MRVAYSVFAAGLGLMGAATLLRALLVAFGDTIGVAQPRQVAEFLLFLGGSAGTTTATVGAILSLGQRQESEMLDLQRVLREQATTDSLTGLANRRHYFDRARAVLERGSPHTVILFDVDHFKAINDSYGHDLGDLVLQRIATLLREALPEGAVLCRLGGEEFSALVPADPQTTAELARSTLAAVKDRATDGILRNPVTLSAGVAGIEADDLDGAMRVADLRLYEAKRAGRARVIDAGEFDAVEHGATALVRQARGPRNHE